MTRTPQQYRYVKHDITIRFQNFHRLSVKAGTMVERHRSGTGPMYAVHPGNVTLLSDTKALFDHDSTYRFIWIDDADLVDNVLECAQ